MFRLEKKICEIECWRITTNMQTFKIKYKEFEITKLFKVSRVHMELE